VAGSMIATSWPATVTIAVWLAPVVFGAAVSVMVALPLPLALTGVSQAAPPVSAAQPHPACVVTCTETLPPLLLMS